jgi:hypothetical protein
MRGTAPQIKSRSRPLRSWTPTFDRYASAALASFVLTMPHVSAVILASPNAIGAIGWSLVLIALLVLAFFGLMKLRRWIKEDVGDSPGDRIGFTLSDFRRLHKEGKMTDEEFERLRSKMLAGAKSMAENLPDPLARKGSPPAVRRDRPQHPPPEGPSDPRLGS